LPARNASFAGRDDQLEELRHHLERQEATVVVPAQALYGLGGVGKTQLALEYAHRYQADYDLIWWIVAEAPGAIPAGLAELAAQLGLVADTSQIADQEQLAAAVLEALRHKERWLLGFDNVPDRQQLAPYLPQGDGQVLITSRNPVWVAPPVRSRSTPSPEPNRSPFSPNAPPPRTRRPRPSWPRSWAICRWHLEPTNSTLSTRL
jgi:hypothetical protein